MARLNTNVHVHHPEKGTVAFGPGDDVPAWATKLITRDDVWDTGTAVAGDDDPGTTPTDEPPRAGAGSGEKAWRAYATEVLELEVPEDAKKADIIALVDAQKEPPRGGDGSGEDEWRAYATDVLELEVPEDASRDDIIALVDEHNADD